MYERTCEEFENVTILFEKCAHKLVDLEVEGKESPIGNQIIRPCERHGEEVNLN